MFCLSLKDCTCAQVDKPCIVWDDHSFSVYAFPLAQAIQHQMQSSSSFQQYVSVTATTDTTAYSNQTNVKMR